MLLEKGTRASKTYHSKQGGAGYLHNDDAKLNLVIEAVKADTQTPTVAPA